MSTFLLAAALLPAIVLLAFIYNKDKAEKEPIGLVVRVFILGAVAGPVAAIIENVAFGIFESMVPSGTLLLVLEYFVGVAAVEEGVKYAALNTIRKNPEFNYIFDAVVYAVAASLGFAALENILYVFDGGLEVALMRALFSVPGHCADGAVMGCFFGMARYYEVIGDTVRSRRNYLLAFLLPVIEHGFYDAALSSENDGLALLALAVEVAFMIWALSLVNRMAKNDKPLGGASFRQLRQDVQPLYTSQSSMPQPPQTSQPLQPPQMSQTSQPLQPLQMSQTSQAGYPNSQYQQDWPHDPDGRPPSGPLR